MRGTSWKIWIAVLALGTVQAIASLGPASRTEAPQTTEAAGFDGDHGNDVVKKAADEESQKGA